MLRNSIVAQCFLHGFSFAILLNATEISNLMVQSLIRISVEEDKFICLGVCMYAHVCASACVVYLCTCRWAVGGRWCSRSFPVFVLRMICLSVHHSSLSDCFYLQNSVDLFIFV